MRTLIPIELMYDENEPRDESGKWTSGSGGSVPAVPASLEGRVLHGEAREPTIGKPGDREIETPAGPPYYHGTSVALAPGDTLEPSTMSGQVVPRSDLLTPVSSTEVYLTNRPERAAGFAAMAAGTAGDLHIYEVRPIGIVSPDPEFIAGGMGADQVVATLGEVTREVPWEEYMNGWSDRKVAGLVTAAEQSERNVTAAASLELGDVAGHAFHGNQWTGGMGGDGTTPGETPAGLAMNAKLHDALLSGIIPPGSTARIWGGDNSAYDYLSESMLGTAKSQIVDELGSRLAASIEQTPELRDQADAMLDATQDSGPLATGLSLRSELVNEWDSQYGEVMADRPSDYQLLGDHLAQNYVDQWTNSAADSDPDSLALQLSVEAAFPSATSSSFDALLTLDEAHGVIPPPDWPTLGSQAQEVTDQQGAFMQEFTRQEYDNTQNWLKEHGITGAVTLYRQVGFDEPPKGWPEVGAGDKLSIKDQRVDLNPASSWSVDRSQADKFGFGSGYNQYMLTSTVPVERILSTARTGRGALREGEVVVLNGPTSADIDLTNDIWT